MLYTMTKPCSNCPFRTDNPIPLHAGRVVEIVNSLERGEFPCHETAELDEDEDGESHCVNMDAALHCAGALIFLEKLERPSQLMRICERLGLYDRRKLDMQAPVFDSIDEMLETHARLTKRNEPCPRPNNARKSKRSGRSNSPSASKRPTNRKRKR